MPKPYALYAGPLLGLLFWISSLCTGCTDTVPSNHQDTQDLSDTTSDLLFEVNADFNQDLELEDFQATDLQEDTAETPLPEYLTLVEQYTDAEHGWSLVEHWSDDRELFEEEDYLESGRNNQIGQRARFFDDETPDSGHFLLYYGANFNEAQHNTPVLLISGANTSADQSFAAPDIDIFCGSSICPSTGAMQFLSAQGFPVAAINFPHMHGDNRYWAEQIGDAVHILSRKTDSNQVDLVGFSKGGFAAHLLASGSKLSPELEERIQKLILVATPNGGMDYPFRHGTTLSLASYPECGIATNTPSVHSSLICYGLWYSHAELSIFSTSEGDFFPGQKQMLARFDATHDLPLLDQDWQTTYNGGLGLTSDGDGIDLAISQGSLVTEILDGQIPATIETYLLCGENDYIPFVHSEHTGPSDGLVFVDSCSNEVGIGQVADNVILEDLNHFELLFDERSLTVITAWLLSEDEDQ